MVSLLGVPSFSGRGVHIRSISYNTGILLLEGLKMCKKSKDKRYRIIIQVAIWDYAHTRVYRYERQTVLINAKSPTKALQKLAVNGTVLKVITG